MKGIIFLVFFLFSIFVSEFSDEHFFLDFTLYRVKGMKPSVTMKPYRL